MRKILSLLLSLALLCTFASAFTDTTDHPLLPYIERAAETGIVTGYLDDTFRPDVPVKRAEFVTMMNRALGITGCAVSPFTDVPAYEWYAPEVEKALSVGYINGTTATTFAPTDTITRGETAVILARLAGVERTGGCGYTDYADTLPDWLKQGMHYAWDTGLFDMFVDRDGAFLPYEPMTRAQCAAVITAFLSARDALPMYMTYCAESDTALDTAGENVLYVNVFGKTLFADLCEAYGADALTFADPEAASEAYNALEKAVDIKATTKELRITGKYLLELTPDLAYVCFALSPVSEETASVTLTAAPQDTDAYITVSGFDTLVCTYPDRVTRIDSAQNLACTYADGKYTVTWDRDDRLTAYSIRATSADGTRTAAFAGDIVIVGDTLTADVTDAVASLGMTSGNIVVVGYTEDEKLEAKPTVIGFELK